MSRRGWFQVWLTIAVLAAFVLLVFLFPTWGYWPTVGGFLGLALAIWHGLALASRTSRQAHR